jgi:hypothetical protein
VSSTVDVEVSPSVCDLRGSALARNVPPSKKTHQAPSSPSNSQASPTAAVQLAPPPPRVLCHPHIRAPLDMADRKKRDRYAGGTSSAHRLYTRYTDCRKPPMSLAPIPLAKLVYRLSQGQLQSMELPHLATVQLPLQAMEQPQPHTELLSHTDSPHPKTRMRSISNLGR